MQGVRMRLGKAPDRRHALSHPRTGIEQFGGVAKRSEIEWYPDAAHVFQTPRGLLEERRGRIVAKKRQQFRSWNAESKACPWPCDLLPGRA